MAPAQHRPGKDAHVDTPEFSFVALCGYFVLQSRWPNQTSRVGAHVNSVVMQNTPRTQGMRVRVFFKKNLSGIRRRCTGVCFVQVIRLAPEQQRLANVSHPPRTGPLGAPAKAQLGPPNAKEKRGFGGEWKKLPDADGECFFLGGRSRQSVCMFV